MLTNNPRAFPALRIVPPATRGTHIVVPAGGPAADTPTELVVDECPLCTSQVLVPPAQYREDRPASCHRCGPQQPPVPAISEELLQQKLAELERRFKP